MQKFKKIFFLLSLRERKHAGLLLIMILIMALFDTIGVASILPFMAVLTNPEIIETNIVINKMFQASSIFGVENNQQFIFSLGVLVFVLLVISLTFKALTTYVQVRFAQMREYSIGRRLVEGYLQQPYDWFLSRHSADLGKTILSEVNMVIGNGLNPLMELIAKSMISISLIFLLIITDPKLALMVGFSLGTAYGLIFYFARTFLKRIGEERLKNNQLRFTTISEAFGAVKEVKVGGLEQTYVKRFANSAKKFASTQASSALVSQLPRYMLEIIAFGGIMLVILYLMGQTGSFNSGLPIISLYVFAGYRLMPALQQAYSALSQLAFVSPSLDALSDEIKRLKPLNSNQSQGVMSFNKEIILKNIHYNYPNASRTALKGINLSIPAKKIVGLVGSTGCGKTTTVDIILGLLEAQKGTLEVDGKIITKQNSRAWQRTIGYVPQHIYLSDDTVSANIAFGEDPKNINQEAVEKATKIANLHEFVINELPKNYQTTIGERGVRLSGGQRQRIGIARALYYNPKVLILDEATSALDNQTEKAVMDAVNNLSKDVTIILIAHRLSTVKKCDKIFLLEKGELKNQGTFEELIKINDNFRISVNN
jgi:ABC-type multidrug transport system fused ATPase/permease subunit